jgi:hypothetical protein
MYPLSFLIFEKLLNPPPAFPKRYVVKSSLAAEYFVAIPVRASQSHASYTLVLAFASFFSLISWLSCRFGGRTGQEVHSTGQIATWPEVTYTAALVSQAALRNAFSAGLRHAASQRLSSVPAETVS